MSGNLLHFAERRAAQQHVNTSCCARSSQHLKLASLHLSWVCELAQLVLPLLGKTLNMLCHLHNGLQVVIAVQQLHISLRSMKGVNFTVHTPDAAVQAFSVTAVAAILTPDVLLMTA